MESKPKPKSNIRPVTPGKPIESRSKLVKSPYRVSTTRLNAKHRPSNSYTAMQSDKSTTSLRESQSKSSLKSPYPDKKTTTHKKSNSVNERPKSTTLTGPELTHQRKFSMDRVRLEVVSNFSYKTMTGYIPGNPAKVNQDSFISILNLTEDSALFAVADGHGLNGKEVSSFVKERFPVLFVKDYNLVTNPKKSFQAAASRVNNELVKQGFDVNFSGSTFVSVYIRGKKLWCANIGDSRAFLARQLSDYHSSKNLKKPAGNHWMSIALSRDHKPNESDESARITRHGGRVEAYQDEHGNPYGPARVWLRSQNIPGLAMSRSFGDKVASTVGVICEPEILELDLLPEDKFIVLGSDGIFEFLSNEDVLKIVVPYWRANDASGACEALANEAKSKWLKVTFT